MQDIYNIQHALFSPSVNALTLQLKPDVLANSISTRISHGSKLSL